MNSSNYKNHLQKEQKCVAVQSVREINNIPDDYLSQSQVRILADALMNFSVTRQGFNDLKKQRTRQTLRMQSLAETKQNFLCCCNLVQRLTIVPFHIFRDRTQKFELFLSYSKIPGVFLVPLCKQQ